MKRFFKILRYNGDISFLEEALMERDYFENGNAIEDITPLKDNEVDSILLERDGQVKPLNNILIQQNNITILDVVNNYDSDNDTTYSVVYYVIRGVDKDPCINCGRAVVDNHCTNCGSVGKNEKELKEEFEKIFF